MDLKNEILRRVEELRGAVKAKLAPVSGATSRRRCDLRTGYGKNWSNQSSRAIKAGQDKERMVNGFRWPDILR